MRPRRADQPVWNLLAAGAALTATLTALTWPELILFSPLAALIVIATCWILHSDARTQRLIHIIRAIQGTKENDLEASRARGT